MAAHRFVFVRHAQASCNVLADAAPLDAAHDDSPLTELGRRQALALAAAWPASLRPGRIYCSPMRRALQTADALATAGGWSIVTDARLQEVAPSIPAQGQFTQADWDVLLERRVEQPDEVLVPGLESLRAQFARVRAFLHERHGARAGEDVTVIVSHAMTIELAMLALLGLDAEALQRFRFRLSNTGVHIIENDAIGAAGRLLLVNSLSHLGRWV